MHRTSARSRAALGLFVTALVSLAGCVMPGPRAPSQLGTVDFRGLYGVTFEQRIVGPARAPAGLMRRVVVDPMLFEPQTRPEHGTVAGVDAIGAEAGDVLLSALIAAGSVVVSPAALRSMLTVGCTDEHCRAGTWVEQVHWLARHADRGTPPLADAPTVALPVTALEVTFEDWPVTVTWNAQAAQLEVTPEQSPTTRTLCPGLKLSLAVARFGAEIFDARTGTLVARATLKRSIETSTPTRWQIAMYRQPNPQYPASSVATHCTNLSNVWRTRVMRALAADRAGQLRTLQGLVSAGIGPLLPKAPAPTGP